EANLFLADHDRIEIPSDRLRQSGEHGFLVDVRALVTEKDSAAADGNDVIVEYALVDRLRILLCVERALGSKRVAARDRFARLARLARGKARRGRQRCVEAGASVDEKLYAGRDEVGGEAGVIRGAFIPELAR